MPLATQELQDTVKDLCLDILTCQELTSRLIMRTPTGDQRNTLTYVQMQLVNAANTLLELMK